MRLNKRQASELVGLLAARKRELVAEAVAVEEMMAALTAEPRARGGAMAPRPARPAPRVSSQAGTLSSQAETLSSQA